MAGAGVILAAVAAILTAAAAADELDRAFKPIAVKDGRILPLAEWPTWKELELAAPKALRGRGLVNLDCQVGASGTLEQCKVIDAGPPNVGLEAVATQLATHYRVDLTVAPDARGGEVILMIPIGTGQLAPGACFAPVCTGIPAPPPPPPPRPR